LGRSGTAAAGGADIAVLVAAGVYLSILRVPHLSDLWSTSSGQVLLVKLGLVTAAVAWGGFHHFVVRPRLERTRWAGRSLVGEGAVAMTILLLAAILVNAKPPADQAAASTSRASSVSSSFSNPP
jgi:putative copper export protein